MLNGRWLCLCLFLAAPSHSGPPGPLHGFMRMDALEAALVERLASLRKKEEFDAKPRPERMAILLARRVQTFEKRNLTGPLVVEELLRWKPVLCATPSKEAARVLGLLPEALRARYRFETKALRLERNKVGMRLVTALTHSHFHIRKVAINSLRTIYGTDRGYDLRASPAENRRAQGKWRLALRRR